VDTHRDILADPVTVLKYRPGPYVFYLYTAGVVSDQVLHLAVLSILVTPVMMCCFHVTK